MTSPPDDRPAERWDDPGALGHDLAAALRGARPAPAGFAEAARAAFAWRTIDVDLAIAELVFDSAHDPAPAGATRSTGSARTLAFQGGGISVEVEVSEIGVVGQLAPAGGGVVTAFTPDGRVADCVVDGSGEFELPPLPPGLVRLTAVTADGAETATEWVSLR